MDDIKPIFGSVNLMALKGARLIESDGGIEGVFIPIDLAKLKRKGKRLDLKIFMYPFKKDYYDYLISQTTTQEERDNQVKPIVLGNGAFVKKEGNSKSNNNNHTESQSGGNDFAY